eukprot:TRINITY_DN771_c0_g2_i6.p3 TRINITY_DN771_c0_g2~~TRINITY_DN771_c0_g2_i6.p3  ORF type:complete len:127 (+),score=49.73 TRINITY_DN771_c0_g2_i6:128-508(+)
MGLVYSPNRMCFMSKPGLPFRAEYYTDIEELKHLAMLVGPYGFKLIDSAIIKHIVDLAIGIKDTVLALQAPLEEIHMNFNKDAKVLEVVKRIKVTGDHRTHTHTHTHTHHTPTQTQPPARAHTAPI